MLYSCKVEGGNFGDDINEWMWRELLGNNIIYDDPSCVYFGAGSLLNQAAADQFQNRKVTVIGSGFGYGKLPTPGNNWTVLFVRGPVTAKILGVDKSLGIGDSVILLKNHLPTVSKKIDVSFIPHHFSADYFEVGQLGADCGINVIDPRGDSTDVIRKIAQSRYIVTESLHGAIFADMLRVPWRAVSMSPKFYMLKWQDWFESLDISTSIDRLPVSPKPLLKARLEFKNAGRKYQKFPSLIKNFAVGHLSLMSHAAPRQKSATALRQIIREGRWVMSDSNRMEDNANRCADAFYRYFGEEPKFWRIPTIGE